MQLPSNMISTKQAAEIIGVNDSRVRQMLIAGELSGVKVNERAWVVDKRSAEKMAKKPHTVGRNRGSKKIA